MTDNIKKVNNPLTIIAIFAGLAEVAGTVALGIVEKDLQGTFIWFVMIFPIILVFAFFITLNFNASVLYAPSDFENDESYLKACAMAYKTNKKIEKVLDVLDTSRQELISNVDPNSGNRKDYVKGLINSNFQSIEKELIETKDSTKLESPLLIKLQDDIIGCLEKNGASTSRFLRNSLNTSMATIVKALRLLQMKGVIIRIGYGQNVLYSLYEKDSND